MKIGIDPKIDCVFHKLFATEENKKLAMDFINSVMAKSGESKIVDLQIVNPYSMKTFLKDKKSIVDVRVKNELGEWFLIEMQMIMGDHYPKRVLYYWSKAYGAQLKEKERYNLLKKVTLISISKDSLPMGSKGYYNHFRLSSVQEKGVVLCEDLNIHTIELDKFLKAKGDLEKWAYFFKYGEELDDENLPKELEGEVMKQAVAELKKFSMDADERLLYESRQMAIREEISREYAYQEAQDKLKEVQQKLKEAENKAQEAKQEAQEAKQKEKEEVAKNMIRKNSDDSFIIEITGLSKDALKKLRKLHR